MFHGAPRRHCFLLWHRRTAARCAEIAERARLRMDYVVRMESWVANQIFRSAGDLCSEAFRAWAQLKKAQHEQRSIGREGSLSRIQVFKYFSAWRRFCTSMSFLQQLRWCEPSAACTPQFASAVWQELRSPRVYRSFLLPKEGSYTHLNVPTTG